MLEADATPQPGDLVVFSGDHPGTTLAERVIMRRTHSRWVHVGIVSANGLMTSARSDGIRTEPLPINYAGLLPTATGCRDLAGGLAKLHTWNGQVYGWGDIFNQLLSLLHAPFSLHFVRAWDCSDTAVQFLNAADYAWPRAARSYMGEGEDVTPADLVRALGVWDVQTQRWQPPQQQASAPEEGLLRTPGAQGR